MARICILLAAYKGKAFAGEMIESILAQDFSDWQLVLSDDGTETAELLEDYARRYPERIIHHISGRRFGSAQNHFLYLLEHFSDSPYMMFCDQDDVWHPDKVRKTFALMKETEASLPAGAPVLVHTDLKVVDGELNEICPSFTAYSRLDGKRLAFHQLLVQNVVTGCTLMINRPLAALAAEASGEPCMLMHDWWLALLASAFGKAVFLPEATMDYRQHGGNTVGAKDPRSFGYVLDRVKGKGPRKALEATAAQAGAFARIYGDRLMPAQKETAEAYAAVPGKGKLARLAVYRKYHLWKKDIRRRIGQLLWW